MATALGIPYVQAYSFGGAVNGPKMIVVHSTECPMTPGIGRSLAGPNWFGGSSAGTSAHIIADPSTCTEMVHDDHQAWHVGPGGNGFTWGAEHCGRAAFSAAEWSTEDGKKMLQASATAAAKVAKAHGIPLRWLSIAQMRAGESGFCSHNDIRLAFGGTTHSDPGPNFPYALYLQYVKAATGGSPLPPAKDGFDMADVNDLKSAIDNRIQALKVLTEDDLGKIADAVADKVIAQFGEQAENTRLGKGTDKTRLNRFTAYFDDRLDRALKRAGASK